MNDIGLLERCDKCGGHLTLMESISNDDGSLWLVKRCLVCYGHGAEEVIQVSSEALRRQVEELQNDNAGMVKFLKDIMKYFDNPSKYGGTWPEFFSASIKQIIGNSHPGATLLKERDELRARCEELQNMLATEFICTHCRTVFPNDPSSSAIPICPHCGGPCFPKATVNYYDLQARCEELEAENKAYAGWDELQMTCESLITRAEIAEKALKLVCEVSNFCKIGHASLDAKCPNPQMLCSKCTEDYFLSQAKEATNAKQIPE